MTSRLVILEDAVVNVDRITKIQLYDKKDPRWSTIYFAHNNSLTADGTPADILTEIKRQLAIAEDPNGLVAGLNDDLAEAKRKQVVLANMCTAYEEKVKLLEDKVTLRDTELQARTYMGGKR